MAAGIYGVSIHFLDDWAAFPSTVRSVPATDGVSIGLVVAPGYFASIVSVVRTFRARAAGGKLVNYRILYDQFVGASQHSWFVPIRFSGRGCITLTSERSRCRSGIRIVYQYVIDQAVEVGVNHVALVPAVHNKMQMVKSIRRTANRTAYRNRAVTVRGVHDECDVGKSAETRRTPIRS